MFISVTGMLMRGNQSTPIHLNLSNQQIIQQIAGGQFIANQGQSNANNYLPKMNLTQGLSQTSNAAMQKVR